MGSNKGSEQDKKPSLSIEEESKSGSSNQMKGNKVSPKVLPQTADAFKIDDDKWDRHSNMPPQMMKRWFGGGPQVDKEITEKFKQDLVDIGHGTLRHWMADRDGKLATIILCDQFSRNIYRGLAEAFSFDHISLKLAKHILSHIDDFKEYRNFERLFIIMPLMHSENVDDCQLCVDII